MKKLFQSSLRGFSLVESLVSITVLALITGIISSVLISTNQSAIRTNNSAKGQRILNESFEAIRSIRDQNFLYLENGVYGLQLSAGVWTLTSTPDTVDTQFIREITISDVYRNASGDIDPNGTQLDDRSKRVSVLIQWDNEVEGPQSLSHEQVITDWQAFERINSTLSEWGSGTLYQTTVSSSGDGALVLDSFTTSWQNSFQDAHYIFNNNADANEIAVDGIIGYMVSNYNGQVPNFTVLDVTNLSSIVSLASVSLNSNAYDIVLSGNYAYVATADQQNELKTIDITTPSSPSLIDQDNLVGPKDAYSIDVDGDRLYIGQEKNNNQEFHIFNIQNPADPVFMSSLEINANVFDIHVVGGVAYLALSNGGNSLLVLDVADPYNIQQLASFSVTPENNGRALAYLDQRLYFASSQSSNAEFKIIDVSNPSSPSVISGAEIGANLRGIDIFDIYAFVTSDKENEEFKVINMEDIYAPYFDTSLDLGADGNGVFSNQNGIFITSDDNTSALDVLTYPVTSYYSSGTFTSNPFDSGSETTNWLNFHWEGEVAPNTTIQFQFRYASTEAGLSSATWTGPDGTNSTYYTDPENILVVPQGASGTRWMQYQIILTGDSQYTPEVYSVRIQYSP